MSALALVPPRLSLAEHIGEVDRVIELVEMLEDADELTEARREELQVGLVEAIAGTRQKVDDTSRALAQFDTAIAAAKAEEVRLKTRRDYFGRQRDRLEQYVLAVLSASKLPKLEGHTSTLTARLNPPAVEIEEGTELPAAYLRTPPPPAPAPDRTAIKEALKAGCPIPGCRLIQTTRLVRS